MRRCWPLAIGHENLGMGHGPLAIGHKNLGMGHGPLAIGHENLGMGHVQACFRQTWKWQIVLLILFELWVSYSQLEYYCGIAPRLHRPSHTHYTLILEQLSLRSLWRDTFSGLLSASWCWSFFISINWSIYVQFATVCSCSFCAVWLWHSVQMYSE